MFNRLTAAGTLAAIAMLAALHVAPASAQYPPPNGSCVVTTSGTSAAPGGSVSFKVVVRDVNGNVVSSTPVTLAVTQQPGTGAAVTPASGSTDAGGAVNGSLAVGRTAGVVETTATASGVSCRASVSVATNVVSPSVALPSTGTGAGAAGSAVPLALFATLIAGAALVAAGARRATHRHAA